MTDKCFACDKRLGNTRQVVYTADGQGPYVGMECYRLIQRAGKDGYQPPKGGPRLFWTLQHDERNATTSGGPEHDHRVS